MLALVGSGEYLPPMQPVDRYLLDQLNSDPKVVCLPTAAGREDKTRVHYWMELGLDHFRKLGAEVEAIPLIDREGAKDLQWSRKIRQANFVYLSGGNPGYLLQTLINTSAWEAIHSVHLNGGIIAGCSAGAMVLGSAILSLLGWKVALGLVPEAIILPHYDEFRPEMIRILRMFAPRKHSLLGIEGDTALWIKDGKWVVLGRGGVTIWDRSHPKRFLEGEIPLTQPATPAN